jgi:hypothetical protein
MDAAPNGTLRVDSPALSGPITLQYGQVGDYQRVKAGSVQVTLSLDGAAGQGVRACVPAGGSVTLVAAGDGDALTGIPVKDPFAAPGNGLAGIRLINATAGAVGPLTLADADGEPLGDLVSSGDASAFVGIPAETTSVGVRRHGDHANLLSVDDLALDAGDAASVVVTGGSGDAPVTATWAVDAQGPEVLPKGYIHTGPGDEPVGAVHRSPSAGAAHAAPAVTVSAGLGAVLIILVGLATPAVRSRRHGATRRLRVVAVTLALAATVVVTAGCVPSTHPAPKPTDSTGPAQAPVDPDVSPAPAPGIDSPAARSAHRPVKLILPGREPASVQPIGILGKDPQKGGIARGSKDGELATIANGTDVGWYTGASTPGDDGPTVMAAHVSFDGKPGVFAHLDKLEPGAAVEVERQDGKRLRFTVDRVDVYPKAKFPTAVVYRPSPRSELRLITCSGGIGADGFRLDNTVASLSLAP